MAKIGKEYIDDLSGLYNRRYLQKIQKEIEASCTKDTLFSLAIVDIDHFKEINDIHGHLIGDGVIKEFSLFLTDILRVNDAVVRYGGDEFICVMPDTNRQDAERIYWRILNKCKQRKFGEEKVDITISAGISSFPDDSDNFRELLKIADMSLYDAKRSGRDRVGTIRKKRIEIPIKVFVGRKQEKETLRRFIVDDSNGVRSAIIKGNIGIGKTRLLKEVLSGISRREILWSNCLAFFDEMSYYAIREIIKYKISRRGKSILDDIPLAYRIEIGKLIPELIEGTDEKTEEIGLVLNRYRLYESIRKIVEIGERRKVIVIDNMQWVDRETIETVKYLLRSLKENPIIFILIYRQEEETEVLKDFTSYISREIEVKEIGLDPLKRNEMGEVVKAVVGEDPNSELVEYIGQESGGNPFYIEEIIKGLHEAGYLKVIGESWKFTNPETEIIPKSIEDITDRKYQSLSNEGKEILEIASVVGRFDIDTIKGITDYNEGHIIGLIEDIRRLGLIKESGDRIEFQEEISRDAVYKRHVAGAKGRMLHKKVGEKLEVQYKGRRQDVIEELAFHFFRGIDKKKGVKYCIEAGDRTKDKYANRNAIQYYIWAEELLKEEKEEKSKKIRIDCLLKRVDVLNLIGENTVALKHLDKGIKAAQAIRDIKREADIRSKIARAYLKVSQYREAIDAATDCIEIYKKTTNKKGIVELMNIIGHAHFELGEYDKALGNYEDASKILRHIDDRELETVVLINRGNISYQLGNCSKALENYEDALNILRDTKNRKLEGIALGNIGNTYSKSNRYVEALKNYKDALNIFSDIGDKVGESKVLNNIGNIHKSLGNYDKSLEYYKNSLRIFRDMGDRYSESTALNNIGNICKNLGNHGKALENYRAALRIRSFIKDKHGESLVLADIGDIYLDWGDHSKALKYYEDALKIAKKLKMSRLEFDIFLCFGNLYLTLYKTEKAKAFINKAHKIAEDSVSVSMLSEVSFLLCEVFLEEKNYVKFESTMKTLTDLPDQLKSKCFEGNIGLLLGRFHTETKAFEKAKMHLNNALKVFEKIRERLNMGRIYYYLGMMELAMGKKSVYQRRFAKALEIFKLLDAKGWKKKVEKAIKLR